MTDAGTRDTEISKQIDHHLVKDENVEEILAARVFRRPEEFNLRSVSKRRTCGIRRSRPHPSAPVGWITSSDMQNLGGSHKGAQNTGRPENCNNVFGNEYPQSCPTGTSFSINDITEGIQEPFSRAIGNV